MPGVSRIRHREKEILFIDYAGCRNDHEMIEILKEAQKIIVTENKEYLQLISVINVFVTPEYMREAKKVAKETPKLASRRAIVGVNSQARRILLQTYNLIIGVGAVKPFSSIEEAKDWLVS
jgi:hypothetical protein